MKPLSCYIPERLRWRIAKWLDRHYGNRVCWTSLCQWAMYPDLYSLRDLVPSDTGSCTHDSQGKPYYPDGGCYCNKLRREGEAE